MSERLSITPLGPYIGAQISGADLTPWHGEVQ